MTGPVFLLALILVLAVPAAGYFYHRMRLAEVLAADLASEASRREMIAEACGEQFILWTGEEGQGIVSPGFGMLTGVDAERQDGNSSGADVWFAALKENLEASDATALSQVVADLHSLRRDFALECAGRGGARVLAIKGTSLLAANARVIKAMHDTLGGLQELLDKLPLPAPLPIANPGTISGTSAAASRICQFLFLQGGPPQDVHVAD